MVSAFAQSWDKEDGEPSKHSKEDPMAKLMNAPLPAVLKAREAMMNAIQKEIAKLTSPEPETSKRAEANLRELYSMTDEIGRAHV